MKARLFIILLWMSLCLAAQEHSVFLGLELGGPRTDFVEALIDKGFEFEEEDNESTVLTGLFDGVGARIEVQATPQSHTVHMVTVYFVEIGANEVGMLMKTRQIHKQLKRKYRSWDYTREHNLEEWSSPHARISLGKKRLGDDDYKTLYVQWQDRSGWETLVQEKK